MGGSAGPPAKGPVVAAPAAGELQSCTLSSHSSCRSPAGKRAACPMRGREGSLLHHSRNQCSSLHCERTEEGSCASSLSPKANAFLNHFCINNETPHSGRTQETFWMLSKLSISHRSAAAEWHHKPQANPQVFLLVLEELLPHCIPTGALLTL